MKTKRTILTQAVAALLVTSLLSTGFAQEQRRRRGGPPQETDKQKPAEKKETPKKAEKKKSDVIAIVGGDINTVTNGIVRRGTILVQDGKILKVGQDVEVPEGAKVIDAKGHIVTPGFVTLRASRIGLSSSSATKPEDYLDPFDPNVRLALGVGITTACVQTSGGGFRRFRSEMATEEKFLGLDEDISDAELKGYNPDFGTPDTAVCPCCGLAILSTAPEARPKPTAVTESKHAVLKMSVGDLDGMLVSTSAFLNLSSGSLTGRLNRHKWRQTIAAARLYLKELAEHEAKVKGGDKKSKPPKKSVSDSILKLVKKEIALRTDATSVEAMRDMIELAKELDYRLILDGATEGWLIPDELAEASVSVVITPRSRRQADFARPDTSGSSIESSRIFEDAGVAFAVAPDARRSSISLNGLAGRDLMALPLEAAFAVRGGATEKTALDGITIVPARMMGLDDRIGSIEEGKDADILILNGQPLDYRTYVQIALVNGKIAYEREKARVYPVYSRD